MVIADISGTFQAVKEGAEPCRVFLRTWHEKSTRRVAEIVLRVDDKHVINGQFPHSFLEHALL
jgi:hypothetical protein